MEQRLATLFASVGNALDSNTYTYSDSDYLVRKILVKFLEDENALLASARHIPDPEQVVESILNYVISTEFANDDPASWYRKAMAITVEFADFAHRNDMSEDSARYAALLPDGHPRVKRVLPVTASAARESLAEWMAADPRLDTEAAEQVRKLYSLDDSADDVEAEFETLKAEALVAAGRMPEELLPIVAAFNLSFAQRSAISKALAAVRRRDRKGRFAREFGRLKLFFKSRGEFFSSSPRIVGPGRGENTYQVESKGDPNIPDGIYEVDAALGENVKAYLPKSAVKGLAKRKEVVAEDDKRFAIELDDFLKTKKDVPNNWNKSGNKFVTKDGKFTATKIDSDEAQSFLDKAKERGDDTIISGTGAADAFDPENPESFLVTDNKGRTKGVAQDWSGIQEIAIANGAEFGESGRGAPPTGPEDRGIPAPTDVSGKPTPPDTPGRVKPEPLGRPPRFPGDKGVPDPTDISGLLRPPRFPGDTEGFQPYDGTDIGARDRNNGRRNKKLQLESDLGRKLNPEEIEAFDLEPESVSVVNRSSSRAYGDFLLPKKEQDRRKKIRDSVQNEIDRIKNREVDLDQDSARALDNKSSLSDDMLGEGYNLDKNGDGVWGVEGDDGNYFELSKLPNGGYEITEYRDYGGDGTNTKTRSESSFRPEDRLEAFERMGEILGRGEWDQSWVDELLSEQKSGPDLSQDQPEIDSRIQIDPSRLSPELREKYQETFDKFDQAIFNNDRQGIADMLSKAALDNDMPDEVYGVLSEARDWVANREAVVENSLARASREDLENLLEDPEFAGWRDRLEQAMIELAPFGKDGYDYDLDQDAAPVLSEKQAEPATGKQYAMLKEFLEERNLDPATEQALTDAIENKNLNKAQASSLIGLGRGADFKEGVDPTKPSERMLNSLQGYLATKDLTPSEINDTLKSLEADGSRDNVEALLNKLRRKKDKPADLNQGTGSMRRIDDDFYEWEDAYNTISMVRRGKRWEVEYTTPDRENRGAQLWQLKSFEDEDQAFSYAEELVKQNQKDNGYQRYMDDRLDLMVRRLPDPDLDQDQATKPSLEDSATDKQYSFLESLLNGKKIDDPNLEAAARTAVRDKNLTKGEVGAFIGALRNLPDRPNVRREPTAKQIASIKRGIIERDFTPEQIKEIEDKLNSGISFEEASGIIDDIKKRPVTAQGMNDLLDKLSKDQDIDTLRYLLDKPEYSDYRTDIKDTLRQLALDTEDPNLQEFIDARGEPDLDQDQNLASKDPKSTALEDLKVELDGPTLVDIARSMLEGKPDGWSDIENPAQNAYGDMGQSSDWDDKYNQTFKETIDKVLGDSAVKKAFDSPPPPTDATDLDKWPDYNDWSEDIADAMLDALDKYIPGPDLDQDQSARSIQTKDLANQISKELDAIDFRTENAASEAYDNFIAAESPTTAGDWIQDIRDYARERKVPSELASKMEDLADRMEQELIDRFGIADSARYSNDDRDVLYIDDVVRAVEEEREMFFETDEEKIVEMLEDPGSYGDNRSGGAEARISENEDGTYTARVYYDRNSEEMSFEDKDEALGWTANQVRDYNFQARPRSYALIDTLEEEYGNAKSPEDALAFADRIEDIAGDLEVNRGDRDLANSLRDYGIRIRDMAEKRQAFLESQLPNERTTPESMDEMVRDRNLNPNAPEDDSKKD